MRVHAYDRDETFCREVQQAIVKAVREASERLTEATFSFQHAQEIDRRTEQPPVAGR